ncbi:hypothetical protein K469DRAFT_664014 [Zopfia rhizophila CBS 207.26]|uniref:FAD-binding domain-containing protein n=1 Tax=Zopfia rhizophila CBS 207.26 TaxID=1314779 RepID=A0A6A6E2K8_9PEZI|nr:hypothetical protein K469DRAFT_664014 [Zopfia rhizophila CBS 207.26]
MTEPIETDLLIIGAGPAGLSLACFLASYGLKGIMISNAHSTADTPRAHLLNCAASDCLRDIGLDKECFKIGTHDDEIAQVRWAHSIMGEEYGRAVAWGYDPRRAGEYKSASPSIPVDIPQTLLEPIMLRYASQNGFSCRYDTDFVKFEEEKEGAVLTTVRAMVLKREVTIRSKYLFGADGARSLIVKQLGLPLTATPAKGLAINVLVDVDMQHLRENKRGNLQWMLQPDVDHPNFDWLCVCRIIKPWDQWMFIFVPKLGTKLEPEPTHDEYLKRIREYIGDPDIPARIRSVSKWNINEIYAERYTNKAENIFCLGDAVHRHPPHNGLGGNTCIQDAFNLAWKIAYVMKGLASSSLLSTYSPERQPVGKRIVQRANQALPEQIAVWGSLGMLEPTREARKAAFQELSATTPEGKKRRETLIAGIENCEHEFNGLGIEMNQRYESDAISVEGQGPPPAPPEDVVLHYGISTYPGSRVPHAWLNKAIPTKPISTIDLAGNGHFTILTGAGGEAWKKAARIIRGVSRVPSLEIRAWAIGWRLDWEDMYLDWKRKREIEEDGCVLVRPDRAVAWRCMKLGDMKGMETEKLEEAMMALLGWKT